MRLNETEGVNVHRCVRNSLGGTTGHYDSIAYACKNMPFFVKRSKFCNILGVASRYDRIANEILMHFRGQRKSAGDVSLSGAIESDGEGDGPSILDTIADDSDLLEDVSRQESIQRVRGAVASALTEREAEVVRLRYGLTGLPPQPQRVVAEKLGISRSYISRIEKKALQKLKQYMEDG